MRAGHRGRPRLTASSRMVLAGVVGDNGQEATVLGQRFKARASHTHDVAAVRRMRGLTLIESAVVIGILSIVVLGVLLTFETVTEQRRVTEVVQDVSSMRAAVSRFATEGLVVYDGGFDADDPADRNSYTVSMRSLQRWDQLAGFLPGTLGTLAGATGGPAMIRSNPWGGTYSLIMPNSSGPNVASAKWAIRVDGVPDDLAPAISKQLLLSGATAAAYGVTTSTRGCGPDTDTAGAVGGGLTWVCVSFEE